MGWLDMASLSQSPLGGLLDSLSDPLNSVPGYSMRAEADPYSALDKKKAQEAEAAAARSVFDKGASAVPQAGISGQQAMNVGQFGSLAPVLPSAPEAAPVTVPALPPPMTIGPVGPVPMPQVRSAAADAPTGDVTTPPNAQPTQGTQAPAIPETSMLGRIGQKLSDNSNLLLGLASGFAGAPSFGTGMSRAFSGAAAGGQLDTKQQAINHTAEALQRRGLPPDVAMAAATNPTILQQILPQVFGAKQRKFTQIGEDMMGNKQFGFVDETSGKSYDMTGKEISHGSQGTSIPTDASGQPLGGQELLAHLEKTDPTTAAGVKGLISGDLNAQGRNLQKLAPLAKLVDPTFDATQYPVRLATRKSYTSGKDFQETQALNTVSGHMGKLMDSADKLDNTNFPIANKAKNWFADTFTGSPELVRFRNDLVTTANELAKAYHGGHVSDSAYAAFNKAINEAQTPAEMKAAIGEMSGLLQSKIEAKESGYRSSMAGAPLPEEYRAINDEAKHAYQKINDWAHGLQPTAAPVKVTSPAEAAKLPKGTRFVDPNGVERIVP